MAHAQKPDFVFRRNGRVHLNRRGRQFSRLLAACSAHQPAGFVLLVQVRVLQSCDAYWSPTPLSFPLHFSSCASPCAITFHLDSTQKMFPNSLSLHPDILLLPVHSLYHFTQTHGSSCIITSSYTTSGTKINK